MIVTYYRFVT